jgi:hypothetical protein
LFGIGLNGTTKSYEDRFEVVEGTVSPSLNGEGLFIYCLSSSGAERPLTVFNNGGVLAEPYLTNYTDEESALPLDFPEEGIINLPHYDNLLYVGPRTGELEDEELRVAVRDPANWVGSNQDSYGLETSGATTRSFLSTTTTAVAVWTVVMAGMAGLIV